MLKHINIIRTLILFKIKVYSAFNEALNIKIICSF